MRKMKDSGNSIVGEMPFYWTQKRLKYLCEITTGNEDTQNADPDGEYPFYVRSPIVERCPRYTFDGEGILVAGDGAGAGRVFHHAYGRYAVHQRVYRLYDFKFNSDYVFYFLSNMFPHVMDMGSAQSTVPSMRLPMLMNFPILIPAKEEAKRIVDFLDRKCSKIDSLSADVQKEIEILQEYRRALITEAVTKGLDPDVEMKDSGIEWVDSIPESWDVTRIGYESWIRARLGWKGLKADEYVDEGYPFLSAFNIVRNKMDWNGLNFIDEFRYEESPEIKLKVGDLILVKDGAGIGKCARIDSLPFGPSTTNGSLAVITPGEKLEYRFLHFYLQSAMFQNYIIRMMNGMGVPHLSQEELRKIVIPLPPIGIQRCISDYLDLKCAEIDQSIGMKEKQLEVLAEYRKSLIYEYVTGKKEVV